MVRKIEPTIKEFDFFETIEEGSSPSGSTMLRFIPKIVYDHVCGRIFY